jgi:hypothetical protein
MEISVALLSRVLESGVCDVYAIANGFFGRYIAM